MCDALSKCVAHSCVTIFLNSYTTLRRVRKYEAGGQESVFRFLLFCITAMILTWKAGDQAPENVKNFSTISEWWKSLETRSVLWKQRMIPESGEIDWSPQKFDDTFDLAGADVRGITFYWKKTDSGDESNITPSKLEFNPGLQRLFLYPENQENLIVSVEIPGVVRETITIKNPSWFSETRIDDAGNMTGYQLVILDDANQTEIQIEMDEGNLNFLKNSVCNL